ncbi:hypothetical protein WMY93_024754 [Mugilogobius chulae]|uniref:C2H2-type domain-containing protein n=1 Tax=Mugilogobius chulae TaxID=88201 RepID=A0AAW0N4W1_9GOBI
MKQIIPETLQIKEEPEEQEEEQLPEFTVVCVKSEERELTDSFSDADDEEEPPAAQMKTEADGEHYTQVQIKDTIPLHITQVYSTLTGVEQRAETLEQRDIWEKPYSCTVCDKSFAVSSALSVHMRTHTGEKPYSCPTCAKAFVCRSALNVHIRTHTGDKPYSCTVCDKKFMRKGHLETHLRAHPPFSCLSCQKTFQLKAELIDHMKSHGCGDQSETVASGSEKTSEKMP